MGVVVECFQDQHLSAVGEKENYFNGWQVAELKNRFFIMEMLRVLAIVNGIVILDIMYCIILSNQTLLLVKASPPPISFSMLIAENDSSQQFELLTKFLKD